MPESKLCHQPPWAIRAKHAEKWKEIYRVWYLYLLHTPAFIKYIEDAYHKKIPFTECSMESQVASGYDSNWIYPLLPGLHTRFPSPDDFDRLWNRWLRFPAFSDFIYNPPNLPKSAVNSSRIKLVDSELLPDIANDIERQLPAFLEQLFQGQIDSKEFIEWIRWRILSYGEGGPILKLANPDYIPKRNIEAAVHTFLESFPNIKSPPAGEISIRKGPIRFSAPAIGFDTGIKIGDLDTLKRNLSFYILTEENDFGKGIDGYTYIFKGFFGRCLLPFEGQINFTGHKYERKIEENLEKQRYHCFPSKVKRWPGETSEIREFGKWVRDRVGEAKKVMEAVAQGWFPRTPNNSKIDS